MFQVRARTRSARSGVERTNHEATAPSQVRPFTRVVDDFGVTGRRLDKLPNTNQVHDHEQLNLMSASPAFKIDREFNSIRLITSTYSFYNSFGK